MSTSIHNEIDRLFRGNNRSLAASVIGIIADLEDYWPLTVRQVYYQCVAHLLIQNMHSRYQGISKMVSPDHRSSLEYTETHWRRSRYGIGSWQYLEWSTS